MANHGIVGRGVLIDYASWAEDQGIKFNAFTRHPISLDQILTIAKAQGIEGFNVGDILLIRTGWIKQYEQNLAAGNEEEIKGLPEPFFVGVDQTDEMKFWLHDEYFSLVGGDSPAFEAWPAKPGGEYSENYYYAYF